MLFADPDDDLVEEGFATPSANSSSGLPPPRLAADMRGYAEIESALLNMAQSGRMPHALIFSGIQGIGKSTMAFRLAKYLLSQRESASPSLFGDDPAPGTLTVDPESQSAQLIASGGHPDLLVVECEFDEEKGKRKAIINAESARKVPVFMRLTPFMGGWRIVIIDDADAMNNHAQNAILKVLEEPPANALLILVTHRPGMLLPTIRSRCRMVEFTPPPKGDFDALIQSTLPDVTAENLDALHAVSYGSIGLSLRLMEEGGLKSLDQLTSTLESWPNLSQVNIHHLGEIIGKGNDSGMQGFQDILLWVCAQMARTRAKGLLSLPKILNTGAYPRMVETYRLEEWARIHEALQNHFNIFKYGNLDKRQAVLGAFSILQGK